MRTVVFRYLVAHEEASRAERLTALALMTLIMLNVLAVILESVAEFETAYGPWFHWFELLSVAVFSLEYAARLWVAPELAQPRLQHPLWGRLRYMATPMALVDLLAIAPFFLAMLFAIDLRFLRVFRLLRLLKLLRFTDAHDVLGQVLYSERRALMSSLLLTVVLLVFASSLLHLLEHEAQPQAFGSIPAAMWWGIVTITTVGYGDVTPQTLAGRLVAGGVAMAGILTIALPAGIVASGFIEEMRKRNFLAAWKVVAKVPLFRGLDAWQIGQIVEVLHRREAEAGETMMREGEPGHSAYFVLTGRLLGQTQAGHKFSLGTGDVFGELALLIDTPRTATVVASARTGLLVLDRGHFLDLLAQSPALKAKIEEIAHKRLADLSLPPIVSSDQAG